MFGLLKKMKVKRKDKKKVVNSISLDFVSCLLDFLILVYFTCFLFSSSPAALSQTMHKLLERSENANHDTSS